jgi:ABC-type glycerol-3-phosphate transport system permease component
MAFISNHPLSDFNTNAYVRKMGVLCRRDQKIIFSGGNTLTTRKMDPRRTLATLQRHAVASVLNVLTTILALLFMFPFAWSVSSALKRGSEVAAYPPRLLPRVPQWRNFAITWTSIEFNVFFANSTIVTVLSLIGIISSSLLVAYGFSRFQFPGREILFLICLSGMMMPVYVTIIPLFDIFRMMRWIDTLKPLIIPSYFGSAFTIFLLRQFIMSIPFDLDESALIDGASRLTILIRIILPNCKAAVATVAIFSFMGTWNEFLSPLIFLDSVRNYTLPLGLWFLRSYAFDHPGEPRDHLLMAGSLITTLPVLCVFAFSQRYFIEGIVMSGIKG